MHISIRHFNSNFAYTFLTFIALPIFAHTHTHTHTKKNKTKSICRHVVDSQFLFGVSYYVNFQLTS